jgi:predicted nucleic acid-binding protein
VIYFDSSALVKRYVREDGSDAVRSLIKQGEGIATSKLTYPEILSAFGRKHRAGELGRGLFGGLLDQFEADWKTVFVIELHDELLPHFVCAGRVSMRPEKRYNREQMFVRRVPRGL